LLSTTRVDPPLVGFDRRARETPARCTRAGRRFRLPRPASARTQGRGPPPASTASSGCQSSFCWPEWSRLKTTARQGRRLISVQRHADARVGGRGREHGYPHEHDHADVDARAHAEPRYEVAALNVSSVASYAVRQRLNVVLLH